MTAPKIANGLRWPLRVTLSRSDGVAVLSLAGRVAHRSAAELSAAIDEVLTSGDRGLVIDFEAVDYISSAGLLALETAAARVREAGGSLVLSGLDGPVLTAFRLAAIDERFNIQRSKAEAIDRLNSSDG